MKRSLQRHLSLMLGAALLAAGLLAAIASFLLAYGEAREFQDDNLRQIAVLNEYGSADSPAPDAGRVALRDPESRIIVVRLPGERRPAWLPADIGPGFHILDGDGERLRVFVHPAGGRQRTVVAQPTDARDEIAINSALRTLLPSLLLIPLLAWLIVRILRREFAPIARLAADLDRQSAGRPVPLADEALPDEIAPFVQAINRLLGRTNELLAQQRRFVADAAHELRSPLTALAVQARNLRQAPSPEAMRERIAPLEAGIERARSLTGQLLDLARIEAGHDGGADGERLVDLPSLARQLIADFLPLAEARGIDLGLEENARDRLSGSPEGYRLILANALDNALKYAPAGGEVTLRLARDGDCALLEVIDNGPGIPAGERERALDAFYRLPGSTGTGSGLGLSIAWAAAERLGGRLGLHDRGDAPGLVLAYRQPLPAKPPPGIDATHRE